MKCFPCGDESPPTTARSSNLMFEDPHPASTAQSPAPSDSLRGMNFFTTSERSSGRRTTSDRPFNAHSRRDTKVAWKASERGFGPRGVTSRGAPTAAFFLLSFPIEQARTPCRQFQSFLLLSGAQWWSSSSGGSTTGVDGERRGFIQVTQITACSTRNVIHFVCMFTHDSLHSSSTWHVIIPHSLIESCHWHTPLDDACR